MNDDTVDWRELMLDAIKEGHKERCEEIVMASASNINEKLQKTLQAGRNARLKHFVMLMYSLARMAAFSAASCFDVDCDALKQDQIDSVIAALDKCGHAVEILQKTTVLQKNDVIEQQEKKSFSVLRIKAFPEHVRAQLESIDQEQEKMAAKKHSKCCGEPAKEH